MAIRKTGMALNPEEQIIHTEEARAWCIKSVRDLPEHALPELMQVVKDLQAFYCDPMEILPVPKGKPS